MQRLVKNRPLLFYKFFLNFNGCISEKHLLVDILNFARIPMEIPLLFVTATSELLDLIPFPASFLTVKFLDCNFSVMCIPCPYTAVYHVTLDTSPRPTLNGDFMFY